MHITGSYYWLLRFGKRRNIQHRFSVPPFPNPRLSGNQAPAGSAASHLQQVFVDRKAVAAPRSPPRAFPAGGVVLCAPPANCLHRAVVPLRTAPAAGAGCPAVDDVEVDVRARDLPFCTGHGRSPPLPETVAYASDIRPETFRSAFFPVKYIFANAREGMTCTPEYPRPVRNGTTSPSANPDRIGSPIWIVPFRMFCPPSASDVPSASDCGTKSKSTVLPAPACSAIPASSSSTSRAGEIHHEPFKEKERLFFRGEPGRFQRPATTAPFRFRGG